MAKCNLVNIEKKHILSYLYTYNLVLYTFTFRYSLARRAFPKAKYYVVCTQNSQCVTNSVFQNGKLIFPYFFSVKNTGFIHQV